jgi:hypothetical protein
MHSDEEVADTYLRLYELKQQEDFWAWQEVHELLRTPEIAWWMTRLLISKAPSKEALGPLEDLLYAQPVAFMEMVAAAARSDERPQFALSNVGLEELAEEDPAAWEVWAAIKKEFDLDAKRAIIYPESSPR